MRNSLQAWWQARQPRERRVLAAGAVLCLLLLAWVFVHKPMVDARAALVQGNARLAADLGQMRQIAARHQGQAGQRSVSNRSRAGQSLLAVVDGGLRELGLGPSLRRIEPAGEGRVRVRLDAVPFDTLVAWLETLAAEQGVRLAEMAASRAEYAGQVDIQMLIEEP
ncbi:MAG: type II secretion system protein M [Xanthomonadales bacterium]|nr:type II secretion system protein M [Xanthomonadales bacterium]